MMQQTYLAPCPAGHEAVWTSTTEGMAGTPTTSDYRCEECER